jgi:mannose-1-phosphate guanylyltransferase
LKAVLLAAGRGSRLRPLSDVLPKCLMPVLGVPLLEIWLQELKAAGVSEVLINTSYLGEDVRRFLSKEGEIKTRVTVETELLGTAGTLFTNRKFAGNGDIMVIHADNLSLFDHAGFVRAFDERPDGCVGTMMTFDTDSPRTCGIVVTDAGGVVREMHEKVQNPPGHRANGAVYILSAAFMQELLNGPVCADFSTQVLPRMMGRMNEFFNADYHRDIGSVELYRAACAEMWGREDFPFNGKLWRSYGGSLLWKQWIQAWQQTDLRVVTCRHGGEAEDALASEPDVILIESVGDLAAMRKLARMNPAVTFIPWKVETGA